MIKAVYEPTKQECWLNMDFVVDVFDRGAKVIAFTLDDERGGYLIDRKDFEKWMESEAQNENRD